MTAIDIIIIVAVLICLIIGYRKGLLGTVLGAAGTFLPLVIAWFAAPKLANWLMNLPSVSAFVNGFIMKNAAENSAVKIDTGLLNSLLNSMEEAGKTITNYVNNISSNYGEMMVTLICFFIILIGCVLIVKLLKRIIRKVDKLPVIGTGDRLLGIVLGLIVGLFVAIMIVDAVYYWQYYSGNTAGIENISRAIIAGWILNHIIL